MKIVVIGSGLMGNGIALACAQAGYQVVNVDTFPAAIDKAKANTAKLYDKRVPNGTMTTEEAGSLINNIC